MIYITGTTDYTIKEKTAVTLGKFDGIHRGHRLLIDKILQKKNTMKTLVFTFDMNPLAAIRHQRESLITTNEERRLMIENMGIDYLYECSFTEAVRMCPAADFVRKIVNELSVAYIVVGTDFRFGYNREGDYRLLLDMAKDCGYEIDIVDKEEYKGREISSTYVREMISAGDIDTANELLGYPVSISGEVGFGRQLGRTIGIPTANIIPEPGKLLPPNGVYVSKVYIDNKCYDGVTNIGVKPTVGADNDRGAETFILDFNQNIYGSQIKIELFHFLRPERRFDSVEELKNQMEQDILCRKNYQI